MNTLFLIIFFAIPSYGLGQNEGYWRAVSQDKSSILRFEQTQYSEKTNTHKRILLVTGSHGNERSPVALSHWLMQRLADGQGPLSKLADTTFDIIPVLNPSGYSTGNRLNANRVNLNRNFGVFFGITREFPGGNAFSEAETQYLRTLFVNNRYHVAIDIHGYAPMLVAPSKKYTKSPALYTQWMRILAKHLPRGYQLLTAMGLGDGGSFEDWAFWSENTFSYCLEMRSITNDEQDFITYESHLAAVIKDALAIEIPTTLDEQS